MIVKSLVRKIKIQRLKGRGVRSGVGCIRAYDGFSVVLQPSVRKKTLFMVGDSGRIVGQVLENKTSCKACVLLSQTYRRACCNDNKR